MPRKNNNSKTNAAANIAWLRGVSDAFGTTELQLHTVELFLRIAEADRKGEPLESRDLVTTMELASSTISRNIGTLGEWSRFNKPGMRLVTAVPDLADRRRKPLRLTPKGKQVLTLIDNL